MSTLLRFQDNDRGCWSRVDLDSGEPIYISIAQSGIIVKRSNIGLLGPKLYNESNVYRAAMTGKALFSLIDNWTIPDEIQNPILRAFTQTAMNCKNASELTVKLNEVHIED